VLMLAAQEGNRVGAAVPFYGVGPAVPDQYAGITAAVLGHYGEDDSFYPADQARGQEKQIREESRADVRFEYYPAGHAFHNDENLLGTYHDASARLAWQRTIDFLHERLG
jgi:carboxymethylenebutenolidase